MNDASKQLHALLESGRDVVHEVAATCGVAQPLVLAWARGQQKPDSVSRAVLEQDFEIPAQGWKRSE